MSQWIAAITRGHNGGVCLLKDGEIVFAIEEERLSRQKYDGGPYAAMVKILDYTDKIDFLVIAHTQPVSETAGKVDFTGDDVYTGLARKLGLIDNSPSIDVLNHPQVVDLSHIHHKLHAACAFYRSGFETATAVIVDGAGTFIPAQMDGWDNMLYELESIFTCEYPYNIKTIWKHLGGNGPFRAAYVPNMTSEKFDEEGTHEVIIDDGAGGTNRKVAASRIKTYAATTSLSGLNVTIDGITEESGTLATGDELLIYDASASANRRINVANFLKSHANHTSSSVGTLVLAQANTSVTHNNTLAGSNLTYSHSSTSLSSGTWRAMGGTGSGDRCCWRRISSSNHSR